MVAAPDQAVRRDPARGVSQAPAIRGRTSTGAKLGIAIVRSCGSMPCCLEHTYVVFMVYPVLKLPHSLVSLSFANLLPT